ncbi:hypothetical protein ABPG74_011078 [Tetrahymena malaccensis]
MSRKSELAQQMEKANIFGKSKRSETSEIGNKYQSDVKKSIQESQQDPLNQAQRQKYKSEKEQLKAQEQSILGFFQEESATNDKENYSSEEEKVRKLKGTVSQKDREKLESELNKKRLKSPAKPYNWNKLNEREKTDAFVTTYQHNLQLKSRQNDLENELKKMMTQLSHIKKDLRYNSRNLSQGDTKALESFDHVEIENLKIENTRLKQKIEALASVKSVINQKQKVTSQNKLIKAIKQQEQERNMAALSEEERQKLSDMLKVIDNYKIKLKESEQQIKMLQDQVLKQDKGHQRMTEAQVRITDLQNKQEFITSHYEQNKIALQNCQAQLKQAQLAQQKEQMSNQELKTEIDILKNEIKHYEKLEDELTTIKAKNNTLEKQLQQLAIDPLFRDFKDQSINEVRLREVREENFKIKEEIKNLKEMNDNLNEKLKFVEKQNLELTDELSKKRQEFVQVKTELEILRKGSLAGEKLSDFQQSDFIDALGLVKWDGKDPKWRHLELTEKNRADEVYAKIGDNPIELKKKIQHLILEKGELGLHLERQATMLRTKIEIDKEKERLHKLEIDQLNEQLRIQKSKAEELAKLASIKGYMLDDQRGPTHLYEIDNVKYDKNVQEFITEDHAEDELGPGENFFDIYIGTVDLDENVCQRQSDTLLNMQEIMTFFTVDFYNHDTQHTTIVDGKKNSYNFQATFKVKVDEFFITFLKEKYLKLELYHVQQQNAILFGTANVPLGQLISENTSPSISAVIEQTVKVRSTRGMAQDQFIACLNIKYRMRYPINRNIEWASEKMKFNTQKVKEEQEKEMFKEYLRKRLVIKIDKAQGHGFMHQDQLFVFFNFMGKDYITPNQMGPNPIWNYENVIDVVVDENFRSMCKNDGLKLIVFNDQVDNLNHNQEEYMEEDILGSGVLSLSNLIDGDVVYPVVKIIGKTSRGVTEEKGQLHVLVYWYEGWGEDYKPKYEHMLLARDWENKITRTISDSLRSKGLALTTSYYVMNRDQDEYISKEDFYSTIRETLGLKIPDEELDIYYHRLPQPFTKQNFESVFRNYLIDTSGYTEDVLLERELEKRRQQQNIGSYEPTSISLKMKNLSLEDRRNYERTRIKVCALLSKKLQNKTVNQIFKEIDDDGNGQISLFNLSNYLTFSGWKVSKDEIQNFLKVIDFNKDGQISLDEFKQFVYNSEGQNQGSIDQRQIDHFISTIKQKILYYLKQQKYSFQDLFKLIDNDRSGTISNVELMIFLSEKLNIKLKFEEIQIITFHFDKNNDDQIDLFEFIDSLKVEAQKHEDKYDSIFSKEKNIVTTIESICIQLNNYMVQHKKTRGDLFDLFDSNNDKFISEMETKKAFSEMNIQVKPNELKEFYEFLDSNNDKKVSIKEFISTIKNELTRLEKKGMLNKQIERNTPEPSSLQQSEIRQGQGSMLQSQSLKFGGRDSAISISQQDPDDQLNQKLSKNVKKYKSLYEQEFKKKSVGRDWVSVMDFQKTIKDISKDDLSDKEINHLVRKIVKQNERGNILYQSFLSLDQQSQRVSISENPKEQLTKQIFSRIGRILREKRIDYQHAFERIDKDKNNSISLSEFKSAFKQMGLNLTEEEIEDMYAYVDRDGKNGITIEEFASVMFKSQF